MKEFWAALRSVSAETQPLVERIRAIQQKALEEAYVNLFAKFPELQTLQIAREYVEYHDEYIFAHGNEDSFVLINGISPDPLVEYDFIPGKGYEIVATDPEYNWLAPIYEEVDNFFDGTDETDIENVYGACIEVNISRDGSTIKVEPIFA